MNSKIQAVEHAISGILKDNYSPQNETFSNIKEVIALLTLNIIENPKKPAKLRAEVVNLMLLDFAVDYTYQLNQIDFLKTQIKTLNSQIDSLVEKALTPICPQCHSTGLHFTLEAGIQPCSLCTKKELSKQESQIKKDLK